MLQSGPVYQLWQTRREDLAGNDGAAVSDVEEPRWWFTTSPWPKTIVGWAKNGHPQAVAMAGGKGRSEQP
ncbi:hypothetical protein N7452_007598 [Penicillium brevicompactum]|uniref:Uncharacterized protein n=1 Tax=Penicillium brevicompactum TaxID=5074 RepID=A0A9W9QFI4_PENBR|nr:hypothetical protein N7452_007598 [Penicillium brevicompactum]